jgi:hypothetical protein
MSWGAQNRSKDAKTPSGSRGRSEKPELDLWPVQPYRHRTRSRVIKYWHQGADVLTVSLPTTPSKRTRKNGPLQPEHAIWSPLIFAQNRKLAEGI